MVVTKQENQTEITEFQLVGFVGLGELKIPVFCLFLLIYLVTIVGNILIILLIVIDPQLHTPMYWFLGNLSCPEICYSSNILPVMLASILYGRRRTISVIGCILQHCLFGLLAATECCLLVAMSYDRYVAIYKPLHYTILMNNRVCFWLIAGSWIHCSLVMSIILYLMDQLKFCGPSETNHFFCELHPILKLVCSNTHMIELATIFFICFVCLVSLLLNFGFLYLHYFHYNENVMCQWEKKSFLNLLLTPHGGVYFLWHNDHCLRVTDVLQNINRLLSLLYTIITPLFNPLIYSLRNREVKEALRKAVEKLYLFL